MKKIYLLLIILYVCLLVYLYLPQGYVKDEGNLELYFCHDVNCSFLLTQLIESSSSIKCAFYDLEELNVVNSLEKAEVLIFEENYFGKFEPVSSNGLMHHKFCVFDERIVLTGSWNPTIRGTYFNDNLVLVIYSPKIASAYLNELKRLKGKNSKSNYKFNLDGVLIDLCFSPEGNCENLLINEISKVKTSVNFLTFTFTSSNIANAILERNVSVQGVIEKSSRSKYTVNLPYMLDGNKYTMHEKVFILDNVVVLGSYNPTKAANSKNDENMLIIRNDKILTQMNSEFERIYGGATVGN